MKNAFDGLIHRLDTAKERTSEFNNMLIEVSQAEMQRWNKWNRISNNCGTIMKGVTYM